MRRGERSLLLLSPLRPSPGCALRTAAPAGPPVYPASPPHWNAGIKANVKDGVLRLEVPKTEAAQVVVGGSAVSADVEWQAEASGGGEGHSLPLMPAKPHGRG